MEFTRDIYFDNDLTVGKEAKITYSGDLFQNGSTNVNIVYGFGEAWDYTTTEPMERTENGFVANIQMRDFNTFNFCFSNENNCWDNNNCCNYISPILPEVQEIEAIPEDNNNEINFGTDYSASIDDIIEDILGNTTKQNIVADKDNNSVDKILETINEEALPEIEELFNDLFFERVKEDEKDAYPVQEISMETSLAEELKEVGKAVEEFEQYDNSELIKKFNELFELSEKPISFEFSDETNSAHDNIQEIADTPVQENIQNSNVAAFSLDNLVSNVLEPVIDNDETSLFEDIKAEEEEKENSLVTVDYRDFTVGSRRLNYFYRFRKKIRLAFLKLAKLQKNFIKQLGL